MDERDFVHARVLRCEAMYDTTTRCDRPKGHTGPHHADDLPVPGPSEPLATPLMDILKDVSCEVIHAQALHGNFRSSHEGYGVIAEEFRELEVEIFTKNINYRKVYNEAMQLAAMGVKMMQLAREKGTF
jgi:hypothetical protein